MFGRLWKIIFLFLVCAIFVFSSVSVQAQSGITISGTVTDTNGAAVVGATVRVLELATNREITTTTNGEGRYELTNLAAGSYRISVEQAGFAAAAESVTVVDQNIARDFTLAPGVIRDEVTVTAGKGSARVAAEVPQTVTVTTAEDIEHSVRARLSRRLSARRTLSSEKPIRRVSVRVCAVWIRVAF